MSTIPGPQLTEAEIANPGSMDKVSRMGRKDGRVNLRNETTRAAALLIGLVIAAGSWSARAAEPARVRTLTYDSAQKDWVEIPPPPTGTVDGDLYAVRRLNAEGNHGKALTDVKKFIKEYGKADSSYPEALLAQADAMVGLKQFDKAHAVLQAFLNEFGGMDITTEALRLEFVVADAYLSGVKRRVWGIFRLSGVEEGYKILDQIAADHADSKYAEMAIKAKADHLFRTGDHTLAEIEYARLLRSFPQSRYHAYALRRAADSALASFAGADYDEAALIEAQERFNDYRTRYRAESDRSDVDQVLVAIREMLAEKAYRIGDYYERTDHLSSAVFQYRLVVRQWADSVAGAKAKSRLELLGVAETVDAGAKTEP